AAQRRKILSRLRRSWLGSFAAARLNKDAAPPRYHFKSGRANTYKPFLKVGGSMPASRSNPAINPPFPTSTATYCLPLAAYVIVLLDTGPPSVVSHKTFPLSASKARKLRLRSPQKITSPAVAKVAATPGTRPS